MTLFAHLALQFGSHPENLATEALGYVLQRTPTARHALRDLLRGLGSSIEEELAYATQATGDDDARPDLVGRNSVGAEPLVIEVKFWAGLTENQPLAYLDRLPEGGTLLFVAPAARGALLWAELRRRCVGAGRDFTDESRSGAHIASTGGRRLVSLSWRHLLAAIRVQLEAQNERAAVEDIAQLEGLCDRMDSTAFLPLSPEELTSSVYRRVVELGKIVDDVTIALVAKGLASTKSLRTSAFNGVYGRYLALRGTPCLLSCDTRNWVKLAPTPLWLSVFGPKWSKSDPAAAHRALAPLEAEHPKTVFEGEDGFPAVALFVPTGAERDTVIQQVIEQIASVGALIAPLGVDNPEGPPAPPED